MDDIQTDDSLVALSSKQKKPISKSCYNEEESTAFPNSIISSNLADDLTQYESNNVRKVIVDNSAQQKEQQNGKSNLKIKDFSTTITHVPISTMTTTATTTTTTDDNNVNDDEGDGDDVEKDEDQPVDKELSKKIFFNSDSEISHETDCSSMNDIIEKREKKTKYKCTNPVSAKKSIKRGEDKSEELTKLLRLANKSLAFDKKKHFSKKSDNSNEKKSTEKNNKSGRESLLDFVNKSEDEEGVIEAGEKYFSESCEGNDLEAQINFGVKDSFLLSSDEDLKSENDESNPKKKHSKKNEVDPEVEVKEEIIPEETKTNEKEEKRVKKYKKRRRKGSLRNFIANELSSTDGEEDTDESVEIRLDETPSSSRSRSNSGSINSCTSSSNGEIKVKKQFLKKWILSESSDSDIQQIPIEKEKDSPMKGRKNINKILKKDSLEMGTKQARKLETERKKRLSEKKKVLEKFMSTVDSSKLILDFDPDSKEELLVVDSTLCSKLKPHQREGVKFMWDSCFESLNRLEQDNGSGCILAHCMGLGKTLQVITLVHTLLTHDTGVKSVMILCPLNTVRNWLKEFKMWLSDCGKKIIPFDVLSCSAKRERSDLIKTWANSGGVLILNYEMFRSLMNSEGFYYKEVHSALSDPGPDLVVCDEGHLIKNMKTALSKCISGIKTLRRIVLTGTPLQNNLIEYYCMVQFVKPNILGTLKEFMNGFVNPIKNGQFEDSTQVDVRLMKRRAHVLHSLLDGFIQRFGYYVLTPLLPEKQEYVIKISLTETQDRLYRFFLESCSKNNAESSRSEGLLDDFHWLQRVWTHPRVMLEASEKEILQSEKFRRLERRHENWERFMMNKEEYENINSSGKLVLLFKILKICQKLGDKILIFSQYLSTLNLIEYFLKMVHENFQKEMDNSRFEDSWILGEDYFRIDGSTNTFKRFEYCKKFNDSKEKRLRLFLISTRAGGMGINLIGANRVIIFDVSWNPSHDLQSIFRVYRFGQVKPCYIYRFLAEATMEEKIYKRQVTKLSLAHRIVDEHQIERHYSMTNLHELYSYNPTPKNLWTIPNVPKDNLFAEILASSRDIIVGYHEHDSLLENKEEEELTEEERRAAWEDFEKERFHPLSCLSANLTEEVGNPFPKISQDVLQLINACARGTLEVQRNLIFNETEEQMCKIVDVRTLQVPNMYGNNMG